VTPAALAAIHRAAFTTPRPWSEKEFADFLDDRLCFLTVEGPAFALGRVIAGEVELLTLATDPAQQGRGYGRRCLAAFEAEARQRGAETAFLEVAADNDAARALYASAGWRETGVRPRYYHAPDGTRIDAQIMSKTLT
jgi:ribosomal-protein-alanine N-acetyltransferase